MRRRWGPLATASLGLTLVVGAVGCSGEASQPEASVDAFCERIAPLANLANDLESGDPDLGRLADDVGDAAAVAPTAVRPSVEAIADALATMTEAAASSGEEGQAALAAAFSAIEGERAALERASDVVEGYAERECGVDLTPEATGDSGDTGPPEATTDGQNP